MSGSMEYNVQIKETETSLSKIISGESRVAMKPCLPSNTPVPRPTPLTTQNRTSTVHALSHSYAANPQGYNGVPQICSAKLPNAVNRSPNPTTCLIPGPIRPSIPNRIHIRSAVLPGCTGLSDRLTDTQTHGQTNQWLAGMVDNYKPLSLYIGPSRYCTIRPTNNMATCFLIMQFSLCLYW